MALSLAAAGCSSEGSDAERTRTGGGSDTGSTASTPETADAFPVTIPNKYGSATIEEAPERVVVVGLVEQDALLALGVTPVATTEWFGDHPDAVWPWATDEREALDGGEIQVLTNADGINFEAVAALRPDVIIGLYSGLTKTEYATLSKIAPVVAQPEEYVDYAVPWQESTVTVGKVVGKVEEAEALVAEVEDQFTAARKAHPEFEGRSAAVATPYEGIYVYGAEDPRGRFVEALGMEVPAALAAMAEEEFGFDLSEEKAELLDVDVIVWLDREDKEGASPLGGPLYAELPVHTEGREVFLDSEAEDALGGAMSFVTVLSLPYLLDGVVPLLSLAVDGDTSTEVPTS
ncbi:iron-siderophore ABC transporter substrate-binding protein [soil metagenome]